MDSGKDDEARSELEKILEADPRSVDARVQLGFLYGRAKRYDEAVGSLQEAVNLEPKRPELFLYLGTALQRASQYDRAADRAAGRALGRRQATRICTSSSGVVYEKQQRFDDAVESFRRVLVLDPKHAESYNYIGYMYAEKGMNLSEAIQLIQQALAIEPENGYFIDSLGWAYYQQGRYPEALRELQRAVGLAKEDPVLFDHLGDAYLKNGLAAEAISAWERSLQVEAERPHRRRGEEEDQGRAGESAPGQGWRAQGRAEVALAGRAASSLPAAHLPRGCASLPARAAALARGRRRPWRASSAHGARSRDLRTLADITDPPRRAGPSASPACSAPRARLAPLRGARALRLARARRGRRRPERDALGGAWTTAPIIRPPPPTPPAAGSVWRWAREDLVALSVGARALPTRPAVGAAAPDEVGPSLRLAGRRRRAAHLVRPRQRAGAPGGVDGRQEPGPGDLHADAPGGAAGGLDARDAGRQARGLGPLPRPQR